MVDGSLPVLYLSLRSDMTRGGQHSLLHLIEKLDRTRYSPYVVAPGEGPFTEELAAIKVPSFDCPLPHLNLSSLGDLRNASRQMASIIREVKPVIIHGDAPRNTHLAALAQPFRSASVILRNALRRHMESCCSTKRYRGHSSHCSSKCFSRVQEALKMTPPPKLITHLRVANYDGFSDRLLAAETDAFISISHGVAERFTCFPQPIPRKIRIIYNAVDIHRFNTVSEEEKQKLRKEFQLPLDKPIVAFLAGFVPFKRHDFFLDLWPQILENTGGAFLAMAGHGPADGRKRIEKRVEHEGLTGFARVLPFVSEPQKLLNACDILILPSDKNREEGFGRVVIEANACGLPVVASDIAGTREAVDHGETGFLRAPDDVNGWINSVSMLLTDENLRKRMGNKGRDWAEKKFSLELHAQEVMRFYDELLAGDIG